MSHDMWYAKVIIVAMEVIWGLILIMDFSNDLQLLLNIEKLNTEVITFHLVCHLKLDKKKSLLWSWRSS